MLFKFVPSCGLKGFPYVQISLFDHGRQAPTNLEKRNLCKSRKPLDQYEKQIRIQLGIVHTLSVLKRLSNVVFLSN